MSLNTSGSYNSAFGQGALNSNTTASNNTAMGYQALFLSTTGAQNTAVGYQAGYSNTIGTRLTAIGYQAGYASTGSFSVFIGAFSGQNTTGGSNTLIGDNVGVSALTTGTNNILIGPQINASSGGVTNTICISGTGSGATTDKGSNTGFISPNSGGVYQGNNSTLWSVTSDQRIKKNIVDNNTGLEKINQIQVRNFEYRLPEEITEVPQDQAVKKQGVQLGVIAQELQQILPECVKIESTGVMSVDADNLTWYLVNAVKELTARIKQLEGN
jgi:hypothetical protein